MAQILKALKFLWDNKSWLALVIVVIAAALIITGLYASNSLRGAKIGSQETKIEQLTEENRILKQNAAAIEQAVKEMRTLAKAAEGLKDLIRALPADFKERLKNEEMDRLNYCLGAFFRDGVLPADCGDATLLPGAYAARVESRR